MDRRTLGRTAAAALASLLLLPAPALASGSLEDAADQWLPRSDGAEWTYAWANSDYSPTPRIEKYRILARNGTTFRLRWDALGGADNDVASSNRYAGHEKVTVPAFPQGITAAKVGSEITQAGAIGDPFGTGVRTVWWVRGVGP